MLTASVDMGTALLNTIMGMGTVFVVLIFISYIISLFKLMNKPEPVTAPVKEAPAALPEEEEEESAELSDDLELAAVITAAIAAYQGTSQEGFTVRSIKRAHRTR